MSNERYPFMEGLFEAYWNTAKETTRHAFYSGAGTMLNACWAALDEEPHSNSAMAHMRAELAAFFQDDSETNLPENSQ